MNSRERFYGSFFVVKLAREAFERHIDGGLHEGGDQKS